MHVLQYMILQKHKDAMCYSVDRNVARFSIVGRIGCSNKWIQVCCYQNGHWIKSSTGASKLCPAHLHWRPNCGVPDICLAFFFLPHRHPLNEITKHNFFNIAINFIRFKYKVGYNLIRFQYKCDTTWFNLNTKPNSRDRLRDFSSALLELLLTYVDCGGV